MSEVLHVSEEQIFNLRNGQRIDVVGIDGAFLKPGETVAIKSKRMVSAMLAKVVSSESKTKNSVGIIVLERIKNKKEEAWE